MLFKCVPDPQPSVDLRPWQSPVCALEAAAGRCAGGSVDPWTRSPPRVPVLSVCCRRETLVSASVSLFGWISVQAVESLRCLFCFDYTCGNIQGTVSSEAVLSSSHTSVVLGQGGLTVAQTGRGTPLPAVLLSFPNELDDGSGPSVHSFLALSMWLP